MKTCRHCKIEKPKTDFDRQSNRSYRPLKAECRGCVGLRKDAKQRGVKTCTRCRVEKVLAHFYKAGGNGTTTYYNAHCNRCDPAKQREAYAANPNLKRATGMRYKYGVSTEQYRELLEKQGGVCAICKQEEPRYKHLAIDHVHSTSPPVIRGLLCSLCNPALGGFQDSPKRLLSAIEYLRKADPLPAGLMPCY